MKTTHRAAILAVCTGWALPALAIQDYNNNGVPDDYDIASGNSLDCNANGIPDESDLSEVWFTHTETVDYGPAAKMNHAILVDLNGDKRDDLVATSSIANHVALNSGDGTFGPSADYGGGAIMIEAGDFDRDGDMDLALASGGIWLMRNLGDGAFAEPVSVSPDILATRLAAADLDGDGDLDLATCAGGTVDSDRMSILLNQGDGSFGPAVVYPAGGLTPAWVSAADLDGDGDIDVVVGNAKSNSVSVYLNNSEGAFALGQTTVIAPDWLPNGMSLAAADLDQDGDIDLGIANFSSYVLYTMKNNGDGTFAPAVEVPGGPGLPRWIVAADLNGDGVPDLATTNQPSAHVNNGDGTFAPSVGFEAGNGTRTIAAGDINGDGAPDLAVSNQTDHNVYIYVNTSPPSEDCNANSVPDECDIASGFSEDSNGDGIPDECRFCPPDLDGNGTLDLFDFLAFTNLFNSGDAQADCTGDGVWDLFDFLCFVNAFNEGC
jgi:hypothetical protein